jgi:D-alanyl-lipoteichoic acid acyltransferase DltB (MBOAT superfamily)
MGILFVIIFNLLGLTIGWLRPRKAFPGLLLVLSVGSIYWLQPLTPLRNLDFWLPSASIALTVFVWGITHPSKTRNLRQALPGLAIMILVMVSIAATRYLDRICCLTPNRPPDMRLVLGAAGVILVLWVVSYYLLPANAVLSIIPIILIIALFVVLKSEGLSQLVSGWLRGLTGQPISLAASGDLSWLGFSFLAFRLLHVSRDRQLNRLPSYSLDEFSAYALFFPAVISGPIDRAQHFIGELHQACDQCKNIEWRQLAFRNTIAGQKLILIGALKKFVLADGLALFALNTQNASQTTSAGWTWVLLIAFSLRIYLDFSGYTDIALGVSRLMGIKLPENFDRPYSRQNLTAFWNSWHITLAQWFRSYIFNPFTRYMRTRRHPMPVWLVILASQLLTMALIGLWHGIAWNFLIWGVWHGIGLFIQNRWSEKMGLLLERISPRPAARLALQASGWLATFLFVSLGWVWFTLPTPGLAMAVFVKLVGGGA